MKNCLLRLVSLLAVWALGLAWGQETRGGITGRVMDAQRALIPGAAVVVTNTETNVARRTATNATGYFEVNLLIPGLYSVAVEAAGFKRSVRSGIQLNVGGRLALDFQLEVGEVAQAIEVTAAAPLLDTTTASGGRVIDERQIMQLPFSDLNPFVLAGMAPGMQWTGRPDYRRPFDNAGTSSFNTMGDVGTNEYTIDGVANDRGGSVAYVPPADAVQEFKLETSAFDAAIGHTSGATVNVMTKAGTNTFHGSIYDQHWQKRWNATQHFQRLAWEDAVRQGKVSPNSEKNLPGRQNYYGAGVGGPVWIPKIYDGRDRLFFYFMYSGIMKDENEPGSNTNQTVPKMAWRQGDFSDMLALDAVKYTVYDPRSARRSGSSIVRTPFPGNQGVPVLNPMYKFYEPFYPKPNDVPGLVSAEGFNNYFAAGMPKNERFKSAINRIDYNISDRHRVFGRWHFNRRLGDEYDWTYETKRGLQSNGITRVNKGLGTDYVWTMGASTILNLSASWAQYKDGSAGKLIEVQNQYKPSTVGLPAYMDQKAGTYHRLPGLDFNNISDLSAGYRTVGNLATTGQAKASMMWIKGNHSLKFGWEERRYWNARRGPGDSSGDFAFRNNYTRASDSDNRSSSHALDWASFMMGLPTGISIDTNDSFYYSTRYRALYAHDDWRLTNRLRLNLGLRYEREAGTTERFDRGIAGGFDFNEKFVFSDLVEAAYAKSPLAELPASQFKVRGTTSYLGARYGSYTDGTHHLLPRLGVVYQLNNKTVLRGGYGWFYDVFYSLSDRPRTDGYSQATSTVISNDNGLTFCCGVGAAANLAASRTLAHDPFPVRLDGTRFDSPYANSLGAVRLAGRGVSMPPRDYAPAWQQRWRIGVQREISRDMVIDASYNGSYSRIPVDQRIDFLPQKYWATGMTRNQAIDDDMNRRITNPFHTSNLAPLRASQPLIYNYLTTQGFFTGTTQRKHTLLRQYPNLNGSNGIRPGVNFADVRGGNRYHDVQLLFERRFSRGFHSTVMYTFSHGEEADYYANQFDDRPSYRPQNGIRPHRFVWSTVWELPFGKGRSFLREGPLQHVLGGWQLSWIYQYQNGPVTGWGNRFFYGDIGAIGDVLKHDASHARDIHVWFDPNIVHTGPGAIPQGFNGFEGRSSMQPGSYHVQVFPTRLDALRADGIRTWDIKILRKFNLYERLNFKFSADLLNATNHTNFGGPNTDPTNRNFGRVTSTNGYARVIQLNARIEF